MEKAKTFDSVHTGESVNRKEGKIRQSNFEIVRIICMFLIIMHHYALYSGFTFVENISVNKLIVQFFTIGGKIGVNVFIIITGYFMINSKFNVKKVINLILQTFTYTVIFLIINYIISGGVSFKEIIKSIMPITYSQYWFITYYIILYILSPFINKFIENSNQNEMRNLITILIVIFSIIPTFISSKLEFSYILWFITLYLIGAYIQKYYKEKNYSKRVDIILAIMMYLLIFLSVILLDLLSYKISLFNNYDRQLRFSQICSTLALLNSIFIFLAFKNIKVKNNKYINRVASTVLGIYIIHENIFVRNVIWKNIFKGVEYINSNYLIINAIISVIVVFVISSLIEYIRQISIGRLQNKLVDKLLEIGKKVKVIYYKKINNSENNN